VDSPIGIRVDIRYLVSEFGGEERGDPGEDEDGDAQEAVHPVEDWPPSII